MGVVHLFLLLVHNISSCLFTQHIAYFTLQCALCQPGAWCFLLYPSCGSQIGRDLNETNVYHISTLFPRFNFFSPVFLDIFIAWHCSLHALQLTSRHATSLSSQISQLFWTFWNWSHHELQTFVVYSSKEFDSGGLYLQKMTSFPGQSMMKKREFSSHKCRGVKYRLI